MINSVHFELGAASELLPLFAYSPGVPEKNPAILKDAIEHAVNQTLLRDHLYSAWAVVMNGSRYQWKDDDVYSIKLTSPNHDVGAYAQTLPKFLQTVGQGLDIYNRQQGVLDKTRQALIEEGNRGKHWRELTPADFACSFLPPFGLSMVNTNSIQLLHYPPAETVTYMDYLYSPTNRRWENLLGYNGYPGAENTLVETIVDIAPIAAPGGSRGGNLIEPVLEAFEPYAMSMLKVLLRESKSGATTQPVVAYGGPVGNWLWKNFSDTIEQQGVSLYTDSKGNTRPEVGQAFSLRIHDSGAVTPVMCANHPIKFDYYDKDYGKAEQAEDVESAQEQVDAQSWAILTQDLVASGWQAEMSQKWYNDPDADLYKQVRLEIIKRWKDPDSNQFQSAFQIFKEQVTEFGLHNMPEVDTDAWMKQLESAVKG